MSARLLVIDGIDGSGKTSIAHALARRFHGRYVKAFAGEFGQRIRRLNESGRKAEAEALAIQAVRETLRQNDQSGLLVFDRHWLSILVFISEESVCNWRPFPPTVLAWANADILRQRLEARGTAQADIDQIAHYAARYDQLATRYGVPRVDTSHIGADDAAQTIIDNGWAAPPGP